MHNLISKTQSLFLVAILAIFPSANAFSAEEAAKINEKIQKVYDNISIKIKKMRKEIEELKNQIAAGLNGSAINEDNPFIKDIRRSINNIEKLITEKVYDRINKKISFLEQKVEAQSARANIDLEMSRIDDLRPDQAVSQIIQKNALQ